MNYTPVRYHLLEAILSDRGGEWTVREMTARVSKQISHVPAGSVQDSLYTLMADNLLEAVPFQGSLTVRLRHDVTKPQTPTAVAATRLALLLASWKERHGSAADYLPDLREGGDHS